MNTSNILNITLALCLLVLIFKISLPQNSNATTQVSANMNDKAKTLLDETTIGSLDMKNRFIRASIGDPTNQGFLDEEKMIKLYTDLAKGGVGTILTGYTIVDEREKDQNIFSMYDDKFISQYSRLAEEVKKHNTNFIMQLVQLGSAYHAKEVNHIPLGASAIANHNTGLLPKEMSEADIKDLVRNFASAAARAKKAGFNGVEIHASHNYLLHQFATSYYNHRTDKYGGNRENRYRLTIEVYDAIREAVGPDFPIWIKVHSEDSFEGGVTHEDCLYICKELDKRGIDAIEISGDFQNYRGNTAYFKDIADKVAKEVSAPIIVTGGNRDFDEMEKMINETDIEYVGLARPLMKNPEMINDYIKSK